ncbi:MAG: hypothetical protein V8Q40_08020 [Anaerosacchariphilus sp.]
MGGITGQMAPDLTLRFDADKIEELRGEINKLGDLVDDGPEPYGRFPFRYFRSDG